MLRNILSVIAGIVGGALVISAVEWLGQKAYPQPGIDFKDPQAVKAMMEHIPPGALLLVALGWLLGAFVAGAITTIVATNGESYRGYIAGALLMASAVANMLMLPHPIWFWFTGIAAIALGTWLGIGLGAKRTTIQKGMPRGAKKQKE